MLCCVCGEPFEDGDMVMRLAAYRFAAGGGTSFDLLRARFEDGSSERMTHLSCPVVAGAPMSLIGAGEGTVDE